MFLNPLMLAGLGGAMLPLVLHLLSRARYRGVDWGAMMFLCGVDTRQRQSTRLKQWTLLLVRMAMVAVLAVALARPALGGRVAGLAGNGRATAVIILDDSASMNYDENGRTRLDQAREVAMQILSSLNRGDHVSLLPTGLPQSTSERAPTSDLQSVAARLAAVRPGFGEADLVGSLNRATDVLERYERLNREIYIITDRQAVSWRKAGNESFPRAWRARWAGGPPPRITVFTVGGEATDNVAVESVELLTSPVIKDQPADVRVRLRNYGSLPHGAMPLTLSIGNRVVAETTVALAPDSAAAVNTTVRFPDAGSRVLSAAVKSSGVISDDRFDVAVDVSEPLKVLIVSGDEPFPGEPNDSPYGTAAGLLRLALAPFATTHHPGADPVNVTVVSPENWKITNLDRFGCVILANVERLSSEQARSLEQYVYSGGGVLFAPGNQSRVDEYDNALFRFGAGILPASLSPATEADGSSATSLRQIDVSHPIFQFLHGRVDPSPSASIERYFPSTPRTSDAHVLASYVSGKPFLIEGGGGRGRVLLLTTALDSKWTTLPASNFFLPFVQSAVRYLANTATMARNLLPGQPIVASIDEAVDERSATIRLPSGQSEAVATTHFEDRTEIRFNRTEEAGVYRLRYRSDGKERTLQYAVTPPRAESDLTPLTDQQWGRLAEAVGFERIDPAQTAVATAVARDRTGRELWAVLMAAVLALAVVEMVLSRFWSVSAASPLAA